MIDSPGELHGWYLRVALVRLMINRYVTLHSCCQLHALPSVKKTMNTTRWGLYIPIFFYVSMGWEQWGPHRVRNLHTIAFRLVDTMCQWTSTEAELE